MKGRHSMDEVQHNDYEAVVDHIVISKLTR